MMEPEAVADDPAPAGSERPITFRGREIWVKIPSPEQYIVWQRSVKMIEEMESGDDWNVSQVFRALERGRKIIDSILVNAPDVEWLDDQWLDGAFGLVETAQILQLATEAFADVAEGDNRASKRAAKKAAPKKATRRKAAAK